MLACKLIVLAGVDSILVKSLVIQPVFVHGRVQIKAEPQKSVGNGIPASVSPTGCKVETLSTEQPGMNFT